LNVWKFIVTFNLLSIFKLQRKVNLLQQKTVKLYYFVIRMWQSSIGFSQMLKYGSIY